MNKLILFTILTLNLGCDEGRTVYFVQLQGKKFEVDYCVVWSSSPSNYSMGGVRYEISKGTPFICSTENVKGKE